MAPDFSHFWYLKLDCISSPIPAESFFRSYILCWVAFISECSNNAVYGLFSKPLRLSNPVLDTPIFSGNPVLGKKYPYKLYPFKLNCVYRKKILENRGDFDLAPPSSVQFIALLVEYNLQ